MIHIPDNFSFSISKSEIYDKDIQSKFTDFVEQYLINNLEQLGFSFKYRSEFLTFLKENCYSISCTNPAEQLDFFLRHTSKDIYIGGYTQTKVTVKDNMPYTVEVTTELKPFRTQTDL